MSKYSHKLDLNPNEINGTNCMLKVEHEHKDFAEIGPDNKKWKSVSVLNDAIRNHSTFLFLSKSDVILWFSEAACSDLFES